MRLLLASVCLGVALAGSAAADDELSSLNDEFDGAALSPAWKLFHAEYGWPDKIKAMDVGSGTPGALSIQPYDSAWVRDLNAPFLFKTVEGDFDVRARVRVRSADGGPPSGTWSLGGLMARVPNGLSAADWKPRAENWHFITTGVGHEPGRTMTETKGTYNSYSSLKLRPYEPGWVELRMVRVGMSLFVLARKDGGAWDVRDRFYRMEHRPTMQVGLIAYTSSPDVKDDGPENPEVDNRTVNKTAKTDMILEVDWIRFARPKTRSDADWYAQVSAAPLADPDLPEAALLAALGN